MATKEKTKTLMATVEPSLHYAVKRASLDSGLEVREIVAQGVRGWLAERFPDLLPASTQETRQEVPASA